jgi:very-short-patch-repair endonuclease
LRDANKPDTSRGHIVVGLRGRDLGVRFRRQVPIGSYIADFACFSHRVVVEIDGPTHEDPGAEKYDRP